ncbi:hypothetical protein K3495_g9507 [Podosphaera aphanis]|nr:hypothetical protein K3495_g9507 [Podosphaera aphanis]
MENSHRGKTAALFEVYLRLRPPPTSNLANNLPERILTVEEVQGDIPPKFVTLHPPNDSRRRAIEKFAFTDIFKEDADQLDVFHRTGVLSLVEEALGPSGGDGRDGLLATLGVTGSGKTHTIIGSRFQRGLTQLALEVLFRSISNHICVPSIQNSLHASIVSTDPSEAQVMLAQSFLDIRSSDSRASTRAQTPLTGDINHTPASRRGLNAPPIPSFPDISNISADPDPNAEYTVLISMYEVYNDRIFDLLTPAAPSKSTKDFRRRPLLYKHTELSPYRKVVAGLRKILCSSMKEALNVLEIGLQERRVAGTGSNSVSSRSHGFFCVEIKKRNRSTKFAPWRGSSFTIVDLAGSERARDAKTQGATLVEAGKINESLMYLGQCLQMQSDVTNTNKPNLVPFRQCKLTELLFSNSFPSNNITSTPSYRNPQKAIMIVTADPFGDFNATSQILRYSALARETTVLRIPSATSTIQVHSNASHQSSILHVGNRNNHGETERETMEIAALEIARLSDEISGLRVELACETDRRIEAEAHLESLSERIIEIEAEVREECFHEMEKRMEIELLRWKATWAAEVDLKDEHLDRKLEIYTRSVEGDAMDEEDKENINRGLTEDLETENARLRREIESLNFKLRTTSPSRAQRLPLRDRRSTAILTTNNESECSKVSYNKRVANNVPPRKWDPFCD